MSDKNKSVRYSYSIYVVKVLLGHWSRANHQTIGSYKIDQPVVGSGPNMVLVTVLMLMWALPSYYSTPIDNGVKGFPHVTCGVQSLRVDIDTEKVFQGRVYVKGESDKKECSRSFAQGPPAPLAPVQPDTLIIRGETVGIELGFGQCNMRRQRTLFPRGVDYYFTLVISFHSLFITKVDKAYRVRCFYMEADKTVAQQLDVSMLTTHALNEQFPMPQCRYHIRRGTANGPPLRFARVGEPVYHVWECDSPVSVLYGMLVRNCFVDDGKGNKVELINDKGCANDKYLIPNLTYNNELLETFTKSHVFKYADRPSLYFACTVILCFKEDGGCSGITPPNCDAASAPTSTPADSFPALYPGIPAETAVNANQPQQSFSRDVPLSYEEFFKNVTNFDISENVSTTRPNSAFRYNRPALKLRRHKRKISKQIFETDLNAKSFVVLPFDENSESESESEVLHELNTQVDNKGTVSPFVWMTSSSTGHGKYAAHCISFYRFAMILGLIFLLLVFSASLTIVYVRRHCSGKIYDLY